MKTSIVTLRNHSKKHPIRPNGHVGAIKSHLNFSGQDSMTMA